jgi:nitrate/TMAO reductase-like tetraheme cytochrome c subunit
MLIGARIGGPSLLAALLLAGGGRAAGQGTGAGRRAGRSPDVVRCEQCHGNHDFIMAQRVAGRDSTLYVPADILADTRHKSLRCSDCHRGFEAGYPHRVSEKVVPCQTCHEAEGRDWTASIHSANARTTGDAPTCVRCHGTHRIYGAADRQSPTHPLNVATLCGSCHADPRIIGTYFSTAGKAQARTAVMQYYQTVHGAALTRDGLVVSATCNDCHGAHKVLPPDSAESTINRANIPKTCGACHVGVLETFERSAHGAQGPRNQPDTLRRPVCIDCHTAHAIVRADQPQWQIGVVEECGSCHEKVYETYFETYHGKVTRLGFGLAAKCSDCHTAHGMLPASDLHSTVFPANRITTCRKCHPAANENFARYYAHGDPTQRAKYPLLFWPWLFMTALLVGVMGFFLLHTALWLTRLAIDRARARRGAPPPAPAGVSP